MQHWVYIFFFKTIVFNLGSNNMKKKHQNESKFSEIYTRWIQIIFIVEKFIHPEVSLNSL